jgi:hypothetical protein
MLSKLVTIFCLCLLVKATAQTKRHPLPICDVIQQVDRLNGQIVNVRGTIRSSIGKDSGGPYFDEMVAACSGTPTVTIRIISPDAHFLANRPPGCQRDIIYLVVAAVRRLEMKNDQ